MNILRLAPLKSDKSGIADYSSIFDEILKLKQFKVIKAKYFFSNRSTWWLPLDFILRNKYWQELLNNVDIIHAEIGVHQAIEILTLYYLIKKRKKLKIYVTFHDPGADCYRIFKIHYDTSGSFISKVIAKIADKVEPLINNLFFNRVIDYILEQSIIVFVFNQWGAQRLLAKNPKIKGNIKVINHPVFNLKRKEIKKIIGRKILFAGFWSKDKGIELLIQTYYFLRKKWGNKIPSLILAGEPQMPKSSYCRQIKKLVNSLSLDYLVDFPGFLEEDKLSDVLSKAILVIPYGNKMSASASGIYIRGLQAGAVTIVANTPTLTSFVGDNNISLIFKHGEVKDLSNKISQLLRDPKLAYRIAKNGQDFIYEYGNWKRLGKLMTNIYRN
ncbi:hypothetical protein A3D83_02180 [Candidatus Daviesbacteria bacterium RIFCSPHIGHO2_02_FULL_41_10]|uniref:Glycosyl transferase family 1 domain-containing protein n=2 Tax=Candidatus Daviesiibacteriota TaxID=1752718 RepID=A0A1F5ITK2_9BACT|nr:MAG: hypothetical protein A2871_03340 [Candidatus Daviesbacteria bacterium RIFCSPHIGHO2_01_FULL_41_23]OGE32437.1 MAG: hypothetical protein A3D83_02180 [Candidatus Daviesbacteria bacterium RIFCSPHIGHO2_02_FULL_41_10]OGE61957.1 MAG: hypothetical protein A2967_03155 [Candidatus Daviesbacteria bacterium RIFCSPLOWO2_01_FULL_41_32]